MKLYPNQSYRKLHVTVKLSVMWGCCVSIMAKLFPTFFFDLQLLMVEFTSAVENKLVLLRILVLGRGA